MPKPLHLLLLLLWAPLLSAQDAALEVSTEHYGHDDRLGLYLVRATTAELAAGPVEIHLPHRYPAFARQSADPATP